MSLTGFDLGKIDVRIESLDRQRGQAGQGGRDVRSGSAVSQTGISGCWAATVVFTDPPYNVPIKGHVSGLGRVTHREFAMASGEMDKATFTEFLRDAMTRLVENSRNGSLHFICMDWRHLRNNP